jgi:hypothetical protein
MSFCTGDLFLIGGQCSFSLEICSDLRILRKDFNWHLCSPAVSPPGRTGHTMNGLGVIPSPILLLHPLLPLPLILLPLHLSPLLFPLNLTCCHSSKMELYIFGGLLEETEEATDEVLVYDTSTLAYQLLETTPYSLYSSSSRSSSSPSSPLPTKPSPRINHVSAIVLLPPTPATNAKNKKGRGSVSMTSTSATEVPHLLIFGGSSEGKTKNDVWMLNLITKEWTLAFSHTLGSETGSGHVFPVPRTYAACVAVENRYVWIMGGAPDAKTTTVRDLVLGDLWIFDAWERKWSSPKLWGDPLGQSKTIDSFLFLFLFLFLLLFLFLFLFLILPVSYIVSSFLF